MITVFTLTKSVSRVMEALIIKTAFTGTPFSLSLERKPSFFDIAYKILEAPFIRVKVTLKVASKAPKIIMFLIAGFCAVVARGVRVEDN